MASNEDDTQLSNSNTSYSPSPYVYDDNNQYYAYYHRSPVDYPPTPIPYILEHTYQDQDTTPPPYNSTSPYTLPHSPPHPPFRYNSTSPYYHPSSSSSGNSTSSQYNSSTKSTRYLANGPLHGFSPYRHTEPPTVLVNNDNESHAAFFDCNICMEMAKEPVVTSCGHLYCWPCLYNWLYYHSMNNKCPVCNGEVHQSMITPIYGQGTYNSTVRVPPRPCGRHFQSTNQW